jgi:hypothetical protein
MAPTWGHSSIADPIRTTRIPQTDDSGPDRQGGLPAPRRQLLDSKRGLGLTGATVEMPLPARVVRTPADPVRSGIDRRDCRPPPGHPPCDRGERPNGTAETRSGGTNSRPRNLRLSPMPSAPTRPLAARWRPAAKAQDTFHDNASTNWSTVGDPARPSGVEKTRQASAGCSCPEAKGSWPSMRMVGDPTSP